jgi:hypothetical protein
MAPPPTTAEVSHDPWALYGTVPLAGDPEPTAHALAGDAANRVHHVFPIYHPPRPA